jgi:rSAM-associated Gly-rich repeat protein
MADTNRRRFLKGILGALAGAAGTVVLATTATAKETTNNSGTEPQSEKPKDIQERAEGIAQAAGSTEPEVPVSTFLNAGWRNGFGGGFRNGGFANGFGGGFRNGGFRNGFGGGFRNGAFRNW